MSGGENKSFMANPGVYAAKMTILVPMHNDGVGFWSWDQAGPFDLVPAPEAGFGKNTVRLTTIGRRGKAVSGSTHPIPGRWIPYEDDAEVKKDVVGVDPFYCIFTSKLGGCALSITDPTARATSFIHDARENNQLQGEPNTALTVVEGRDYIAATTVTAFFWWKGGRWNKGVCKVYDPTYQGKTYGQDRYPRSPRVDEDLL